LVISSSVDQRINLIGSQKAHRDSLSAIGYEIFRQPMKFKNFTLLLCSENLSRLQRFCLFFILGLFFYLLYKFRDFSKILNMGEVRKRKASNEGKTEKAENPVVISEGGG